MTRCGSGSTLEATKLLREWLPFVIKQLQVRTINDCGCGDQFWIQHVKWHEKWTPDIKGYDIRDDEGIQKLNITTQQTREADLILCKDVFRHLPNEKVLDALKLFGKSAPWLIADSDLVKPVNEKLTGKGRPVDLREEPFSLGDPIWRCDEVGQKFFGLWSLR